MILIERGKAYWEIAKRCRHHRASNPAIVPTAVRDMERLFAVTGSDAVRRRITSFISANRTKPPGNFPPNDGPRYA